MNTSTPVTHASGIHEVRDPSVCAEIYRFRARVWSATAGTSPTAFPDGQWRDAVDDRSRHWICRSDSGELLGAARLAVLNKLNEAIEPDEYLRYGIQAAGLIAAPDRVVVAPESQRQGLAGLLLDAQHAASAASGAVCAIRQASPRMAHLLKRRGWRILGPASVDARFPTTLFTVAIYVFDGSRVKHAPPLGESA